MSMNKVASRSTFKQLTVQGTGGQLTVAGGEPVTVYGITLYAGTADAVFTVTDADNSQLFVYSVIADTSASIEVCWKADNGINVQVDGVVGTPRVTVFHNNPGN